MAMNFLQAKWDLMQFKKSHDNFDYQVDDDRVFIWDKRGIVKKVIKIKDVNIPFLFEQYVNLRLLQGFLIDKRKQN